MNQKITEKMVEAVDMLHGVQADHTEREYARRLLMIYRRYGVGRNPLTHDLPTSLPLLDGSVRFSAAMQSEIDAIQTGSPYFGRVLRTWKFSASELA